jgi:hypothetical protein
LTVTVLTVATISNALAANDSDPLDLPAIMRLTVEGWVASQKDGLLPYGFDFLSDKPIEPDRMSAPNLVRQTVSAFALARYYEQTKDAGAERAVAEALSAFGKRSLPIGKGRMQRVIEETRIQSLPIARWKLKSALDRFGLLYQPSGEGKVISSDGTYGNAVAGGVALALLTELIYSRASGDKRFAGLRTAWLQGLLALRIPGGGFREDPRSIDDTDYDNGEGWLALAVYVDMHAGDRRAAEALSDLDEILIRRYSETPSIYFIGWGGMAAAQRYRTTHDPKFMAYLQRQADTFVERFEERFGQGDNNCGAMEGLTATLAALSEAGENDTARVKEVGAWLSREVAKLPRLQIQRGQQTLALGGDAVLSAPRMREYPGEFLLGLYEPQTRIDAAGHCLSAMVTIERHHLR